jgi:hypothetical protein
MKTVSKTSPEAVSRDTVPKGLQWLGHLAGRKSETETGNQETGEMSRRDGMKGGYNQMKLRALAAFEDGGWLSPPAWAVLAGCYPARAAYTYIKRHLWRWKLVDRSLDRRGLLLYRLNRKGAERLAWLRERALARYKV